MDLRAKKVNEAQPYPAHAALLFLVIVACPGPGYDTSTTLLPTKNGLLSSILQKFVRWDSIYFIHVAEKGYVFEQEWAFGFGYTKFLSALSSVFHPSEGLRNWETVAITGIATSHIAHYLSVLVFYRLSINVFGKDTVTKQLICFLSAALHIISPAGAFLSAPYGEPLFSFLNLSGFYVYSSSLVDRHNGRKIARDVKLLIAAVLFSVATSIRSNGILSGFLFAYDAALQLWRVLSQSVSLDYCAHLSAIIVGGCIVGAGMIIPQFVAYNTYCTSDATSRPWCQHIPPSIYSWVQNHYWNVGFLKYWTVPNLPLFLLAIPTLTIMCQSSLWGLKMFSGWRLGAPTTSIPAQRATRSMLLQLAVLQGLLAALVFTNSHVQIINRISSGYPLWYWYLISLAFDHSKASEHNFGLSGAFLVAIQAMVTYGLIQGALFGSFLPPA